jgi:hypothetical protein
MLRGCWCGTFMLPNNVSGVPWRRRLKMGGEFGPIMIGSGVLLVFVVVVV